MLGAKHLACGLVVLALFATALASPPLESSLLTFPKRLNATIRSTTHWVQQPVDHFNSRDERVWKQRVIVSTDTWKKNKTTNLDGPIFFYTGGEAELDYYWNTQGFVFEMAKDFGAMVVMAEHRYYGQSMPFGTASESLSKDNIGYLSVSQALSDFANVIEFIFEGWNVTPDTPVLTIGGSYAGMMAAWMRLKYSHLVDAAYASSAPILMAGQGYPHPYLSEYGYFNRVSLTYQAADLTCPTNIRQGFTALIAKLAENTPESLKEIQTALKLCSTPAARDVDFLILWARQAFTGMAQSDYPYATPSWPATAACSAIKSKVRTEGALKAFGAALDLYYTDGTCKDPAATFRACADQSGCGLGDASDAWDYQVCTEIVYFMSTNNKTDPFPPSSWTLNSLTNYCTARWGVKPNPVFLSREVGGKDLDSSHIVFTNAELDPWSVGTPQFNLAPEIVALTYANAAHHADLNTPTSVDPDDVKKVRVSVKKLVQQFLFHTRP